MSPFTDAIAFNIPSYTVKTGDKNTMIAQRTMHRLFESHHSSLQRENLKGLSIYTMKVL